MEKSLKVPLPRIGDRQASLEKCANPIEPLCELRVGNKEAERIDSMNETIKVEAGNSKNSTQSLKISFEDFIAKWGDTLRSTLGIRDASLLKSRLENLAWYLGVQGSHDEIEWLALILTLRGGEKNSTFLDAFEKMKSWARVMASFEANRAVHTLCITNETERGLLRRIKEVFRKIANQYPE